MQKRMGMEKIYDAKMFSKECEKVYESKLNDKKYIIVKKV